MDINIPEVLQEVQSISDQYEAALVGNDVAVLDALFWNSEHTPVSYTHLTLPTNREV